VRRGRYKKGGYQATADRVKQRRGGKRHTKEREVLSFLFRPVVRRRGWILKIKQFYHRKGKKRERF